MSKYKCTICGYVYDESAGIPENGIAPGTKWAALPDDFACPICSAPKSVFVPLDEPAHASPPATEAAGEHDESLTELTAGEISAIFSNLAKGCEKQRLNEEAVAFSRIADYFKTKTAVQADKTLSDVAKMLDDDIKRLHPIAREAAAVENDRGALRSLVWSEKVGAMGKSLLERFSAEGDGMLEKTSIWVCDICGFIYIGDSPPEICPVCKVPRFKIERVERR